MNISDAAREAALKIDHWLTKPGLPGLEECVQTAINTATAALTLELETVKRERDVLGVAVNQYGKHFRVCLAEAKCTCGLEAFITTPNYKEESDQLRQQLAEAREDSRRLDWLEKHPHSLVLGKCIWSADDSCIADIHEGSPNIYDECEERLGRGPTLRAAIDAALNPPTDEK